MLRKKSTALAFGMNCERFISSLLFLPKMEVRMYKYRLYPSKIQQKRIITHLITSKEAYNHLLETSIKTYKESKKNLNRSNYYVMVKGKYPLLYSQVAQN